MSQMLTVPGEVVVLLRGALLEELTNEARKIADEAGLIDPYRHLDRITGPLQRLDRHRALLDAIGWQHATEAMEIDLSVHMWALLASLERRLVVERDLAKESSDSKDTEQYQQSDRDARAIEQFLDRLKRDQRRELNT